MSPLSPENTPPDRPAGMFLLGSGRLEHFFGEADPPHW
jgi:hypothetical protein